VIIQRAAQWSSLFHGWMVFYSAEIVNHSRIELSVLLAYPSSEDLAAIDRSDVVAAETSSDIAS
jgi:hypothetical protein